MAGTSSVTAVSTVSVVDPDAIVVNNIVTLTSGGDKFTLSGGTLSLKGGLTLVALTTLTATVQAVDPSSPTALVSRTFTLNITASAPPPPPPEPPPPPPPPPPPMNMPPTGVTVTMLKSSILDTADVSARTEVATFVIVDADDLGANTPGLAGPDAGLFEIQGSSVFLKAGVTLNADTKASLSFAVTADDPTVGAAIDATSPTQTLVVTAGNRPPTILLIKTVTSLTVGAGSQARIRVADIQVSDDGRGTNNLILAGADAALFEVSGNQLFLRAGATLDPAVKPQLSVGVSVDDPAIGTGVEATATLSIAISYPTGQHVLEGAIADARLITTARALDEVCTTFATRARSSLSSDQASLFNACLGLTLDAQRNVNIAQAINALRPEEAFAATDAAFFINRGLADTLWSRLSSGGNRRPLSVSGLSVRGRGALAMVASTMAPAILQQALDQVTGAAGGETSKWGAFVTGNYQKGDRSASAAAGPLDFDGMGVTLGVDYRVADALLAGVAISYADQDGDFDNSVSRIKTKGFTGSAYASLDTRDWKVDTQLSAGQRDYSLARQVAYSANGVSVNETARASFNGVDVTAGLRIRKPILTGATSLEAVVGGTAILSEIDSYQETGAKGFNLAVDDQSNHFVYGEAGLKAGQDFRTRVGTFGIRIDGLYTLNSGSGSRRLSAGFVADPLSRRTIVITSGDDNDNDYFSLGLGFTAQLDAGWTLDAGYRTILGLRNTDLEMVTLSLRSRF